jgi:hypothetical protein
VAYACNPSYLGGRNQEDNDSKASLSKKFWRPLSTNVWVQTSVIIATWHSDLPDLWDVEDLICPFGFQVGLLENERMGLRGLGGLFHHSLSS